MSQAQEDYLWVQRTINTCTNPYHIECIDVMIDLFNVKHEDFNLFSALTDQRNARANNIEYNI